MTLQVLSLFDGISCGKVALERAGFDKFQYWSSEVDKWAIQISENNHPTIARLGDIKMWREWRIPTPDLIMGGSPCQGFSLAGKKLNWEDERSMLFFEFVAILQHYRKYNPDIKFIFENVRMKPEVQNAITEILGVEPKVINSNRFSAQNRYRLYWTNITVPPIPFEQSPQGFSDIMEHNAEDVFYYNEKTEAFLEATPRRRQRYREFDHESMSKFRTLTATDYKGVSNERCYAIVDNGKKRFISPLECERLQTLPDGYTKHVEGTKVKVSRSQRYKALGNAWTVDVIAHILKGYKATPIYREAVWF